MDEGGESGYGKILRAPETFRHTYTSYSSSLQHLVVELDLLASLGSISKPTFVVQGASETSSSAGDLSANGPGRGGARPGRRVATAL